MYKFMFIRPATFLLLLILAIGVQNAPAEDSVAARCKSDQKLVTKCMGKCLDGVSFLSFYDTKLEGCSVRPYGRKCLFSYMASSICEPCGISYYVSQPDTRELRKLSCMEFYQVTRKKHQECSECLMGDGDFIGKQGKPFSIN